MSSNGGNGKIKLKTGPKGASKYTKEFIEKEADALIEYIENAPVPFPYLKDFCYKRGYPSQKVSEVFVKNEKFYETLSIYKDRLECKILYGAMTNKFNSFISMNALKNCCGWRDKFEVDQNINITTENVMDYVKRAANRSGQEMARISNN